MEKIPEKKAKHPHKIFFLWRKRSSRKSGDLYLKLSINLPARNVISGKNALPVRFYKQFL